MFENKVFLLSFFRQKPSFTSIIPGIEYEVDRKIINGVWWWTKTITCYESNPHIRGQKNKKENLLYWDWDWDGLSLHRCDRNMSFSFFAFCSSDLFTCSRSIFGKMYKRKTNNIYERWTSNIEHIVMNIAVDNEIVLTIVEL